MRGVQLLLSPLNPLVGIIDWVGVAPYDLYQAGVCLDVEVGVGCLDRGGTF